MSTNQTSIELKDKSSGFTERDLHSKAILNTDSASLLRYKIQKQRIEREKQHQNEVMKARQEIIELRQEITEIHKLLLKITNKE